MRSFEGGEIKSRRKILVALCAAALATPLAAFAQGFPSKPVRLIVRAPPGGTDDPIARLISPAISKTVGQQVIVDYRPGAGGLVAWEYVAKQPPDGYTLLLAASGLAGYEFEPFYALVVPARTPLEIMSALSEAVAKAMSPPEFRAQFVKIVGSEVVFNTPEQMLQVAKKEAELIDRIGSTANIKTE